MKTFAVLALTLLAAASLRAEAPATFEVGGLTFARPSDWQWVEVTSPMRKAQLKVPGATAEQAADITFFHFGPSGGDVNANVQRWLGQFQSPADASKTAPLEVAGTKVTLVTTEGTFASGMPGGPTTALENYALLGAIIEGGEGNVFIKMTGPKDVVKAANQKFIDFVTAAASKKK